MQQKKNKKNKTFKLDKLWPNKKDAARALTKVFAKIQEIFT